MWIKNKMKPLLPAMLVFMLLGLLSCNTSKTTEKYSRQEIKLKKIIVYAGYLHNPYGIWDIKHFIAKKIYTRKMTIKEKEVQAHLEEYHKALKFNDTGRVNIGTVILFEYSRGIIDTIGLNNLWYKDAQLFFPSAVNTNEQTSLDTQNVRKLIHYLQENVKHIMFYPPKRLSNVF
jgi:hypothetical protein